MDRRTAIIGAVMVVIGGAMAAYVDLAGGCWLILLGVAVPLLLAVVEGTDE